MDPIANLLTIIRNGYMVKKPRVFAPYSKFAEKILQILAKEGYLANVKVITEKKIKKFEIQLKYQKDEAVILGISKVSKPGRRIYRRTKKIPSTPTGIGITIISTPEGVMTDREAKRKNLGGEVICQVW